MWRPPFSGFTIVWIHNVFYLWHSHVSLHADGKNFHCWIAQSLVLPCKILVSFFQNSKIIFIISGTNTRIPRMLVLILVHFVRRFQIALWDSTMLTYLTNFYYLQHTCILITAPVHPELSLGGAYSRNCGRD